MLSLIFSLIFTILLLFSSKSFSINSKYKLSLIKSGLDSPWSFSFINQNEIINIDQNNLNNDDIDGELDIELEDIEVWKEDESCIDNEKLEEKLLKIGEEILEDMDIDKHFTH